jgi:hypothetical protein
MSIHGNQNILPLFLRKNDLTPMAENDELTLAFYLLTKNMKKNEKILSFSRLLWPFVSIPGTISTHIILDGLKFFEKKGKFTNPARQPLIGHILRNIDNKTEIEQLQRIIDVLTYKDTEAKKIGEDEESEYQSLQIDALINPEFLGALIKLIPYLEYRPIAGYMPLNSNLSTENALDVSEKYRKIIEIIKGNAYRWETQIRLIGDTVEKIITELTVKLKDMNARYSSQINKTSSTIDNDQIKEMSTKERDKIDLWKSNEKKKIIENISILFRDIDGHLEELIKKNRFFSRDEILKTKDFDDLSSGFENHFIYLKNGGTKFLDLIESLYQKYIELRTKASEIDDEADTRVKDYETNLNVKLFDRNRQLSEFEKEKQENVSSLDELKNQIEGLFAEIQEIIQTKKKNCLEEIEDLISWSLKDGQTELFSRPIQWFYMPLYTMIVKEEEMMEEHIYTIFPGYIDYEPNPLYEEIDGAFIDLKNALNERIQNDMIIRSNFEYSCENKNLIKDLDLKKRIQQGIKILKNNSIIDDTIENDIKANFNLIP